MIDSFFKQPQKQNSFFAHEVNDNSCFLAIAAGLVDNLLSDRVIFKKDLVGCIDTVIKEYSQIYPREFDRISFKNIEDTLKYLINSNSIAYFLKKFAFVIRQLTIDELCKHFDDPVVMLTLLKGESLAHLRQPETLIDKTIINWIAKALDISICLERVKTPHDIPDVETYNSKATTPSKPTVIIREQAGCFYPQMVSKKLLKNYQAVDWSVISCPVKANNDPSLTEIQHQQQKIIKNIVNAFDNHYQRLSTMFASGDINLIDLQELCCLRTSALEISFYPYLIRYAPEVIEQMNAKSGAPGDKGFAYTLIETFALELALGLIEKTNFYEHLDKASGTQKSDYSSFPMSAF